MTFLGIPPEGYTVNHIDGNRENNRIDNLEWVTLSENIKKGFATGLYSKNQHPVRLVCEKEILCFASLSEASRFLGRCNGYVSGCIKKNSPITADDGKQYTIKDAVTS